MSQSRKFYSEYNEALDIIRLWLTVLQSLLKMSDNEEEKPKTVKVVKKVVVRKVVKKVAGLL